ncbi:MAG: mycothiol transferase [Actinomycetota bacterium]
MDDPVFRAARPILDEALAGLRAAAEGASPELLNRRPAGNDTNTIAVIVTHALHSTRSWLSLATGAEPPARDRPAEFRTVVEDTIGFLASVDALATDCRTLLETEEPFDPVRTGMAPWRSDADADEPVTAAWALIHAFEHLGQHTAHAQLTRQLLDAAG